MTTETLDPSVLARVAADPEASQQLVRDLAARLGVELADEAERDDLRAQAVLDADAQAAENRRRRNFANYEAALQQLRPRPTGSHDPRVQQLRQQYEVML